MVQVVQQGLRETAEERNVPETHVDHSFMAAEKKTHTGAIPCDREDDESCVQHSRTKDVERLVVDFVDIIVAHAVVEQYASDEGRIADDGRDSPTGRESSGVVESAIQPVQGTIRTIPSSAKKRREVKIDANWSWFAENAGFLFLGFEVGHDRKTAYERFGCQSVDVQGMTWERLMCGRAQRHSGATNRNRLPTRLQKGQKSGGRVLGDLNAVLGCLTRYVHGRHTFVSKFPRNYFESLQI